jgi:Tol biopolymer transport system component
MKQLRMFRIGVTIVLAGAVAVVVATPAGAATGSTTRVSSSSAGIAADYGGCEAPWATADGRYVGFSCEASNLVPNDTNFAEDVFLRDRLTGRTERISVASDGTQGQYLSTRPRISANGRYVAFDSFSPNLVSGDTNGLTDVFLRDRTAHTTVRLSLTADGKQAYGSSYGASISPNGRYVTFTSDAANLVPGDTNGWADVFWLDRQTGRVAMVSANKTGQPGNGASDTGIVSANGRYVVFESQASNLVSGDTNKSEDVFVKDMTTGSVKRVGLTTAGHQFAGGASHPSMSTDGRYVTYSGQPSGAFAQVYVRDLSLKTTTLVSVGADGKPGNAGTFEATISGGGRYVSFSTGATNIVPGSPFFFNTYVRDLSTGTTGLASLTYTGAPIIESTLDGQVTDAGLAFVSFAGNVVADTVGRTEQVYFRTF